MITAVFSVREAAPCGFYISGHSGYARAGEDIVCSAVSSAVILTANEIEQQDPAMTAACEDGRFVLFSRACESVPLLSGLRTHLTALQKQYPQYIRVCNLILNGGNTNV